MDAEEAYALASVSSASSAVTKVQRFGITVTSFLSCSPRLWRSPVGARRPRGSGRSGCGSFFLSIVVLKFCQMEKPITDEPAHSATEVTFRSESHHVMFIRACWRP